MDSQLESLTLTTDFAKFEILKQVLSFRTRSKAAQAYVKKLRSNEKKRGSLLKRWNSDKATARTSKFYLGGDKMAQTMPSELDQLRQANSGKPGILTVQVV